MHNIANNFYRDLEKLFLEKSRDSCLNTIHSLAWKKFIQTGLPLARKGMFQYFPLHRMYSSLVKQDEDKVTTLSVPKFEMSTILLYNGKSTEIQPIDKIVVLPLEEAMETYQNSIVRKCLDSLAKENNPFILLNQSLASGVFIYVPPNTIIDTPITITNFIAGSRVSSPFVVVFVGANAKITLSMTDQFASSNNDLLVNTHVQVHVAEGGSVSYYNAHMMEASSSWTIHSVRAFLQRDSSFSSISLCNGEKNYLQDIEVTLEGENASTDIRGLWALRSNHHAHVKVLVSHLAPHTRSYQHFKGVNCEEAQSSFEGKIYVHPEAQKTEAYQLSHQLLLSNRAVANAKPNLEIFADDVKASHGATISKLSSEEIFYLQTRGLSYCDATSCLLQGYYREIVELISIPAIRFLGETLSRRCSPNSYE